MVKTKPFVIDYRKPRVLIGGELVDSDGNIFKSITEMTKAKNKYNVMVNQIVYCPQCSVGNRDVNWGFPRNQRKRKKHKGQCPNCGKRLTLEYREDVGGYNTVLHCKKDEEQMEINRVSAHNPGIFPAQLKWWPINDGKLTLEIVTDLYFNRTMYGQYWLQHEIVRHRVIFNLDTGLCYSMRGIDRNGNPSEYSKQKHRLQNRTFGYMEVLPYAMDNAFVEIVLNALSKYKGIEYSEEPFDPGQTHKVIHKYLYLGHRIGRDSLGVMNYFAEMKSNDLEDMLRLNHESLQSNAKRSFRNLIALSKDNEVEWLPKYMQKRSIRNRLNKRVIAFYLYKWLHACGIRDVNIMNRVVDHYIDEYANNTSCTNPFDNTNYNQSLSHIVDKYCLVSEEAKQSVDFMKWALMGRDANSVYHFIIGVFAHQRYLLTDGARMYKTIVAMGEELPRNIGNIKELHDELTVTHNKCKNKNLTIKYTNEEQKLEMDLDGYSFRLAKDTDSLYDIGKALSICVGSYGRSAAAKKCTIVTMSKDDKYVACIELRPKQKEMIMQQLKGRFNHTVTEIEPVTEWVAATGIKADCYDYKMAIEHKANAFDGQDRDYHVENPRFGNQVVRNEDFANADEADEYFGDELRDYPFDDPF